MGTSPRYWVMDVGPNDHGYGLFGDSTYALVDETQGGIICYAHVDNIYDILHSLEAR